MGGFSPRMGECIPLKLRIYSDICQIFTFGGCIQSIPSSIRAKLSTRQSGSMVYLTHCVLYHTKFSLIGKYREPAFVAEWLTHSAAMCSRA